MKEKEIKQANCGCPYCEDTGESSTPVFCQPCGIKTFTCPSCGKSVPRNRKTCPSCGARIAQVQAAKI